MEPPMLRAARAATTTAAPGDVGLLARAAASIDMFRDDASAVARAVAEGAAAAGVEVAAP